MTSDIEIRPLESEGDFQSCVALQYEIWGDNFGECAPPSILLATQKVGGIAAGAFDAEGRLLGFVFGISGVRGGRLAHWSDMLAVREEVRGQGLGRRLKAYQRERLLELGIEVAYWTYDPLEARNAHLNIVRLGARAVEYVPDMYGSRTGSELHSGLGTDRFLVEWELRDPRVEAALGIGSSPRQAGPKLSEPAAAEDAPIVNSERVGGVVVPREADPPRLLAFQVEVPADIQAVKRRSMEEARAWRSSTRRALLHSLERDFRVTGFRREQRSGRCFYLLARDPKGGEP